MKWHNNILSRQKWEVRDVQKIRVCSKGKTVDEGIFIANNYAQQKDDKGQKQ